MAKVGCLKPFRGSYDNMKDIVLEDGEIAFTTDTSNRRIYFGNGTDTVEILDPFADISTLNRNFGTIRFKIDSSMTSINDVANAFYDYSVQYPNKIIIGEFLNQNVVGNTPQAVGTYVETYGVCNGHLTDPTNSMLIIEVYAMSALAISNTIARKTIMYYKGYNFTRMSTNWEIIETTTYTAS